MTLFHLLPLAVLARFGDRQGDLNSLSDYAETHIAEYMPHIAPEWRKPCGAMLRGEAFSFAQGWQDWVLYHQYFKGERRKWGQGFYVDIGTNHATDISNTLFFDKCLGWRGVCFEPQEQYHDLIRRKRGCKLIPHCVLGKAAAVKGSHSGVSFHVDVVDASDTSGSMRCVGLDDVIAELGESTVDIVSIDIEGNEPAVLRCFPFEQHHVSFWLVEVNKHDLRQVDLFFHRHGYASVETFLNKASTSVNYWIDTLYARTGVPRVYPPTVGFHCTPTMRKYMQLWCTAWQKWKSGVTEWTSCH